MPVAHVSGPARVYPMQALCHQRRGRGSVPGENAGAVLQPVRALDPELAPAKQLHLVPGLCLSCLLQDPVPGYGTVLCRADPGRRDRRHQVLLQTPLIRETCWTFSACARTGTLTAGWTGPSRRVTRLTAVVRDSSRRATRLTAATCAYNGRLQIKNVDCSHARVKSLDCRFKTRTGVECTRVGPIKPGEEARTDKHRWNAP